MMRISVYTDGACRGNPGASSIAFIILDDFGRVLKEHSEYIGIGTNNEAEYKALISALNIAGQFGDEVDFYSDSNLLVNQMTGHWKVKHPNMKPLWKEAVVLKDQLKTVSFKHVPRTNRYIQRVDELANIELDIVEQKENMHSRRSNFQQISLENKSFDRLSNDQDKGRNYPGYLSGSEYHREKNRLNKMVKGFLEWNPNEKVGETENFIVEINKNRKMVLLKEKTIVVECPFKLSMNSDEAKQIIKKIDKAIKRLDKK